MNHSKAKYHHRKEWFKRVPHYAKKKLAKSNIFNTVPVLSDFLKEISSLPYHRRYLVNQTEFEARKSTESFIAKDEKHELKFLLQDSPDYNLASPSDSVVALDCEMVGCNENKDSMLARVSIINYNGSTLYDSFVAPTQLVTDYRYWVTGIGPNHLRRAPSFTEVTGKVEQILSDKIVVGHSLSNDFKALGLDSSLFKIYDLARVHNWLNRSRKMEISLRMLTFNLLNIKIQTGAHSPLVDALATMAVYRVIHPTIDGTFTFSAPEIEVPEEIV